MIEIESRQIALPGFPEDEKQLMVITYHNSKDNMTAYVMGTVEQFVQPEYVPVGVCMEISA